MLFQVVGVSCTRRLHSVKEFSEY